MKTIPLRTLVREPLKVKRLTGAGQAVTVTDNGKPLWVLQPANGTVADHEERQLAIDEVLDELMRELPSKTDLSKIVIESRR